MAGPSGSSSLWRARPRFPVSITPAITVAMPSPRVRAMEARATRSENAIGTLLDERIEIVGKAADQGHDSGGEDADIERVHPLPPQRNDREEGDDPRSQRRPSDRNDASEARTSFEAEGDTEEVNGVDHDEGDEHHAEEQQRKSRASAASRHHDRNRPRADRAHRLPPAAGSARAPESTGGHRTRQREWCPG